MSAPTTPATDAELEQKKAELKKRADDIRAIIDQSTALGLPFGSHFFPYCATPSTDSLCVDAKGNPRTPTSGDYKLLVRWLASVLLAGVLIGLGGPFWFNAFSTLSAVISVFRGKTEEKPPPQPPAVGTPGAASVAALVESPAAAAQAAAARQAGSEAVIKTRAILSRRGLLPLSLLIKRPR